MSNIFTEHHKNILSWQETYSKLPKASVYTSFLFFLIGVTGFIIFLILFPEKPYVTWILLIMGVVSGIWFTILNIKVNRMIKIFEDLNIIKDFDAFNELVQAIISIRKDSTLKEKTKSIAELFQAKNIRSKELRIELNRIALDIQRDEKRKQ